MQSDHLTIDGHNLTLEQVEAIARQDVEVTLDPTSRRNVQASADALSHLSARTDPIYGVNTGYGVFSDRRIDDAEASTLSRNLILSHAVCVGRPFRPDVTRAAMVIRANALAHGLSGVRPVLIDTLLEMLSRGVTPIIPSQGSLGSSGDLGPLAQLGLVLTAAEDDDDGVSSGEAWYQGQALSGAEAMRRAGISRVQLAPKDGLALTNGASFSTAMLALACIDAARILSAAEAAAAMSFEALRGVKAALDPRLHQARPHPGQAGVARRLSSMVSGSSLVDSTPRVQDAYSLRCIPQVLGPIWETLDHARSVATIEINSATDNPLLIEGQAISGGNFHGEPVGMACDFLKIALCNAGGVAERRVFRLVSEHTSGGLPPMLVSSPEAAGLQSGLMMLQYTAASLALENQAMAIPDSVRSLPTSADQEDFNANATTAARSLMRVAENLRQIVAIELLTAARALDMRRLESPDVRFGAGTSAVHSRLRSRVPLILEDHVMANEIEAAAAMVSSGQLLEGVGQPV
jgi:histidine ammonia-lyase